MLGPRCSVSAVGNSSPAYHSNVVKQRLSQWLALVTPWTKTYNKNQSTEFTTTSPRNPGFRCSSWQVSQHGHGSKSYNWMVWVMSWSVWYLCLSHICNFLGACHRLFTQWVMLFLNTRRWLGQGKLCTVKYFFPWPNFIDTSSMLEQRRINPDYEAY